MPEQNVNAIPITETSTTFHYRFTVTGLFLFVLIAAASVFVTVNGLSPLQRYYLPSYVWASADMQKNSRPAFVEVIDRERVALALPADVAELDGRLVLSQAAADRNRGPLRFTPRTVPTPYFVRLLGDYIYGGRSAGTLLATVKVVSIPAFLLCLVGGLCLDANSNRKRRVGIIRRGPKLMDRDEFNRALKSDGIGFRVTDAPTLRELLLAPRWRRGVIRIPYQAETSHALIIGATGTGKSQLLVQLMTEIQDRDEAAIIYDPDGEFLSEFYNPERGDVVLNPLDTRCPYWCPSSELAANEEALTLAASLFPDPARADEKNTFFVRAPRQILARLFEHEPTPQELVGWLASKNEIDRRIKGTEMEEMLSKAAGPQRSGILASLSMALNAFRLLPAREDSDQQWSARQWAETRRGWIFITSRETTRDIQRPLMSMWLDTLLLRLMTKPPTGRTLKPVWLIIDELASLNKLPTLQSALTRSRKYQIKTVLGYQQQSQLQELYGKEGAETITGNPTTKIFFRTGDVTTAKAVSESLGEQEIAREKINYTRSGGPHSRRSKSYTIDVKTERAVSPSQIEGLRNLHGFIRIYDCIAAFTLRLVDRVPRYDAFSPRDTLGFVPIGSPEAYQIIEPQSETAVPVPSTASRPVPPPVSSGSGGGNTIALATPQEQEPDLPYAHVTVAQPVVPADRGQGALSTVANLNALHQGVSAIDTVLAADHANPSIDEQAPTDLPTLRDLLSRHEGSDATTAGLCQPVSSTSPALHTALPQHAAVEAADEHDTDQALGTFD
jgi:hypothetical protein